MKKRPFLALLSAAALMASAASCQCSGSGQSEGSSAQGTGTGTGSPALAERSFKLQNGLQVDLVSGPCGESAAIAVLVGLGSDHDPAGRSGMARLVGRLLATSAPAGRAERAVETGADYSLYSVTATGDKVLEELDEVAAWMSKAAPAEADLERERGKLMEELGKLAGADAAGTALRLAEESVQPARGSGKRLGIEAEVKAITLAEITAFWKAHLAPGNARIAVAGRFDPEKVRARVEAAFNPIAAGTPPALREPGGESTVKGTLVMGNAPSAVAIAVPAPATSDPLFAPFLVLAARLTAKADKPRTWEASYDPLRRPELLFVTGPVGQAEQPEPAAGRMRSEVGAILARPLSAEDAAAARERFQLFLDPKLVDPAICGKDARAFAVARVRRAQLGVDVTPIGQALEGLTAQQLEEAAKLFEPKRTAAIIAGGAMP